MTDRKTTIDPLKHLKTKDVTKSDLYDQIRAKDAAINVLSKQLTDAEKALREKSLDLDETKRQLEQGQDVRKAIAETSKAISANLLDELSKNGMRKSLLPQPDTALWRKEYLKGNSGERPVYSRKSIAGVTPAKCSTSRSADRRMAERGGLDRYAGSIIFVALTFAVLVIVYRLTALAFVAKGAGL